MATEFTGLKKEDHEKLTRAAEMYSRLTGEDANGIVSRIPVAKPEDDAKAKNKAAAENLSRQAETQAAVENARREARRLRARTTEQGEVQPENPGPGQPAMVTQRAKRQGVSRKGEEPEIAQPNR